jgi:hypothetical protein
VVSVEVVSTQLKIKIFSTRYIMKFLSYLPLFITSFIPKKLQGQWNQIATNDPSIPRFCKNHTLDWKLKNNKDYDVEFNANCYINVSIHLEGKIENNTLYENFKFLPKIHRINIVNIVEENDTYQLVETIGYLHFYRKKIYQLWSRKPIDTQTITKFIENAEIKYNVTDIHITT